MAMRYPGGLIATSPVNAAYPSGVWTQSQTIPYASQNVWQNDQYWRNTTLLLHGDGTNGAQNNTFLDSSSNNFTITRNGNTTQGAFTPYQQNGYWSNYFDGNNTYLSIANTTALQFGTGDFTIESFVFLTATPSAQFAQIIGRTVYGSNADWMLQITNANKLTFYMQGSFIVTSTGNVPLNTWTHVAVSRSGSTVRLFINGTVDGTATNSGSTENTSSGNYTIGAAQAGTNVLLTGYLSNLRTNKGTAVYTSAFTPSTTPLTAISGTSLLTCQSNRFVDNSSNAFAITVNGTPSVQAFQPFPGPTTWSASVLGGSGYFDGSGDYLTVADNAVLEPGSSNFTIEAWIYPTASAAHAGIVCHYGGSGAQAIAFDLATLTPQMNISSNGSTWDIASGVGSTAVSLYTWNHVAIVRNSNTFTIYVNGNSSGTATSSSSVANISSTWSIGANTGTGSEPLTGYISNARVVIGTAVYTANFTPPTAPLTAIANTQLLCSFTNAGIFNNAQMNDLETVGNAQISTSVVKYGTGSMAFDGSGDYLIMPNAQTGQFLTGDFTVEYWCRFGSQGTNYAPQVGTLSSASPSGTWRFGTFTNNGGVYLAYHNGSSYVDVQFGSTAYNDNTWRHFALTRSGTTVRAFVNGTQVGTNQTISQNFNSSNKVVVGAELVNPTYFNGYIDDLRITKGVARYTTTFTPPIARMPNQ